MQNLLLIVVGSDVLCILMYCVFYQTNNNFIKLIIIEIQSNCHRKTTYLCHGGYPEVLQ